MDEEEELENTLIGQEEEAPAVNTGDALMGAGPVDQQVLVGGEQPQTTLPVEERGFFDSRLGSAITGILSGAEQARRADAFTRSLAPAAQSGIVDYAISPDRPSLTGSIQENLPDPSSFGLELPQTGSVPNVSGSLNNVGNMPTITDPSGNQGTMGISEVASTLPPEIGPVVSPFLQSPDTPSGLGGPLLRGFEMVNDAARGPNAPMGQDATRARLGGMTLNEYLNAPAGTPGVSGLRTDPQGRMITPTPQPSASALSDFEKQSIARQIGIGGTGSFAGDSAALQARIAERDRLPGETQTERDTRIARSRTTGGQTEGLSFDDARRRAEGQLAARGVRNPSASQVNALARSIQAAEPERLEALETQRALDAAKLRDEEAKKDFKPQVVEIGGQKLIQLAPNYYQPVRPEPTAEEPFEPRVLEEGGFTYYEVAPNRFERQPKDTASTTEETSGLITMDGEAPVAAETTPQTRVTINTQAEYDALAVGTPYIDSQGTPGIKK